MDVLLLDWGPAGDGPEDEGQDGQPAPHPEHQEEDGGRRGEGNDAGIATILGDGDIWLKLGSKKLLEGNLCAE